MIQALAALPRPGEPEAATVRGEDGSGSVDDDGCPPLVPEFRQPDPTAFCPKSTNAQPLWLPYFWDIVKLKPVAWQTNKLEGLAIPSSAPTTYSHLQARLRSTGQVIGQVYARSSGPQVGRRMLRPVSKSPARYGAAGKAPARAGACPARSCRSVPAGLPWCCRESAGRRFPRSASSCL